MSESTNPFASDHLRAQYQSGIAAFFALAQPAFKSVEAVVALNLQATRALLTENEATLKSALQTASPVELFTQHVSASQQAAAKALSYSRQLFDIATHTQAELTQAAQAHAEAQQERAKSFAESFPQNAPAGFAPYLTSFNSTFAAFNNAAETFRNLTQQTIDSARNTVESVTAKAIQQPATQEAAVTQAAK
ncbi:MAG TPA: TIGR01841 family phasin [Paraburkholderia sp.]|jgi:phasin family protein|uniref:TIGR01841 family phasin n=1 Tax=Paraburkholderia sp. TaxID=1926495 RepID=UPI002DEA8DC8|nr:TIGR01841 family phasin [Paraburkholderia sp.]HEV3427285.1 TIGR01841 family phasin [Paraburkholderia sp.]